MLNDGYESGCFTDYQPMQGVVCIGFVFTMMFLPCTWVEGDGWFEVRFVRVSNYPRLLLMRNTATDLLLLLFD